MCVCISLSMLVLNSTDQPENVWLPKRMHLDNQHYKNQNMKNLPQHYSYSSNNDIPSFKQAGKCPIMILSFITARPRPIMLKILPIMLLSSAQKICP